MQRKSNPIISIILLFAVMITGIMTESYPVSAANSTIKIFIGDGTSARHHMSMTKGSTSEEFRFELKGYEAKSSTYTSSNPSAFRIVNTGKGFYIHMHKAGTMQGSDAENSGCVQRCIRKFRSGKHG